MIFYFLNEKMGETHMEEHKQKVYFTEPTCWWNSSQPVGSLLTKEQ